MKHTIIIEVETPPEITGSQVADEINRLIQAGYELVNDQNWECDEELPSSIAKEISIGQANCT